jgi:membrane-bound lytic murein transglycosylase F
MKFLGTIFLGLLVFLYSKEDTLLQQIEADTELRVAILSGGPTTYYKDSSGREAGFEYELAKRFADELDVTLRLVIVNSTNEILQAVTNHQVHFAAAGLVVTPQRQSLVRFGPPYQKIRPKIIYRRGSLSSPTQVADLTIHHRLNVIKGSHQIEILKVLKTKYPQITWQGWSQPIDLIQQVSDKKMLYALVNSNELAYRRLLYPELQIGFELPYSLNLAWAFPQSSDNSLYLKAIKFFNQLQFKGELEQLRKRYYGHLKEKDFDYVDIRTFLRRIKKRLPKYQPHFEKMAKRHNLDWRLLAAIGYQESKWNPRAVSGTGVRGLMMLTQSTAEEVGVKNRRDPYQSIQGGTKYFVNLKKRIDKHIQEPDRTWFTLAAYNVGLGHLRDAQKLTKRLGGNPDRWTDVRKHLPKLSKPHWYKQTKYGKARGDEPVKFVKNIRRFYDILILTHLREKEELETESELEKHKLGERRTQGKEI